MHKKENKEEDIVFKAAHILNKFLQAGHPFVDGNKRTGFVTLWLFLQLNGFKIKFSSYSYINHVKKINKWASEKEKDNEKEIIEWINNHLK